MRSIRSVVGKGILGMGCLTLLGWSVWVLSASSWVMADMLGGLNRWVALLISFVLFPLSLTLAPWYALVVRGDWSLLLLSYGGYLVTGVIMLAGAHIAGDDGRQH